VLVFENVMDIPRTHDSQILILLRKQGLGFLLITLVLRLTNILLSVVFVQPFWVIGIIMVEPIIAMMNARLIVCACEFDHDGDLQSWCRSNINEVGVTSDSEVVSLCQSHETSYSPFITLKIPSVSSFGSHPLENGV